MVWIKYNRKKNTENFNETYFEMKTNVSLLSAIFILTRLYFQGLVWKRWKDWSLVKPVYQLSLSKLILIICFLFCKNWSLCPHCHKLKFFYHRIYPRTIVHEKLFFIDDNSHVKLGAYMYYVCMYCLSCTVYSLKFVTCSRVQIHVHVQ